MKISSIGDHYYIERTVEIADGMYVNQGWIENINDWVCGFSVQDILYFTSYSYSDALEKIKELALIENL